MAAAMRNTSTPYSTAVAPRSWLSRRRLMPETINQRTPPPHDEDAPKRLGSSRRTRRTGVPAAAESPTLVPT
jgi:hypothetical protein